MQGLHPGGNVVPNVVHVVEGHGGVVDAHFHEVRSRRAVGEPKHGVGGHAWNDIERPQGLGHPVHAQLQREAVHPVEGVMANPNVQLSLAVGQGQRRFEPHRVHPQVGRGVGLDREQVPRDRGVWRRHGVHLVAAFLHVADPKGPL